MYALLLPPGTLLKHSHLDNLFNLFYHWDSFYSKLEILRIECRAGTCYHS